ncbi:MAG: M15 family metallopeptidase [Clostridium sp.]
MYINFKRRIVVLIFLLTIFFLFCLPNIDLLFNEPSIETNSKTSSKAKLNNLNKILDDEFLILVNKENPLSDDYVATNIVESNIKFISYITTTKLNNIARDNAIKMFNDAKRDGITLLGASGYRSNSIQKNLFNNNIKALGLEEALKYSAAPGTSEHETGLALDIVSTEHKDLTEKFENTRAFKWLKDNSYKYGFILRYPKDKVSITKYSYEPWHYRYIGNTHAERIYNNNLTLEEYISSINEEIHYLKSTLNN